MEPLLAVEDIHSYYGKSHILHGISLEVGRGEVVGLLGRNGVGKAKKEELLDKVYQYFPVLAERRRQPGGTLSGGEHQMLAIARAMMLEPKIMLLDEPTEGLMPRMVSQIGAIIDVLHQDHVAVLLVEQNVPLTLSASDRIYIIEKGVVRHHAPAAELRIGDAIIHQYLGV